MKRHLLMTLGAMTLALAVPSAALAHGHHHHKGKAHHAKFRLVHIGATLSSAPVAPSTTTTTTPTTPPTPENAAKVASYTNGVLTLTLNDGSTVSGKVTSDTHIGCIKPAPTTPTPTEGDQSPGDDNGQGDDQSRGDVSQQEGDNRQGDQQSGDSRQSDQGDDGQDGEAGGEAEPPCDTSALTEGAIVRSAELRIGPSGNEFESVWLVR